MRGFLFVVIMAGLGAVYYHQKHQPAASAAANKPVTQTQPGAAAAPTPREIAVTQPEPLSEHNWMKRSLDRAREVRDQSAAQTRKSQDP